MRIEKEVLALKVALDKLARQIFEYSQDAQSSQDDRATFDKEAACYFRALEVCKYVLGDRSIFDKMMEQIKNEPEQKAVLGPDSENAGPVRSGPPESPGC